MIIVQIEHKVLDYKNWLKAFDSDPIDREKAGVQRYCPSLANVILFQNPYFPSVYLKKLL